MFLHRIPNTYLLCVQNTVSNLRTFQEDLKYDYSKVGKKIQVNVTEQYLSRIPWTIVDKQGPNVSKSHSSVYVTSDLWCFFCMQSVGCCSQYVSLNSRDQGGNANTFRHKVDLQPNVAASDPQVSTSPGKACLKSPHTVPSRMGLLPFWSNPSVTWKRCFKFW